MCIMLNFTLVTTAFKFITHSVPIHNDSEPPRRGGGREGEGGGGEGALVDTQSVKLYVSGGPVQVHTSFKVYMR